MSSTNNIYHHLFVPIQPKSILKKSPSPRFHDLSTNFESSLVPSNDNVYQYEIDRNFLRTLPPSADLSSDDEQQQYQRSKIKPKKTYYRSFIANGTLSSSPSSSDNDDERKAKLSLASSKTTLIRSNKHQQKDMQLDEFMRKYQQQGGIHLPTKEDQFNS